MAFFNKLFGKQGMPQSEMGTGPAGAALRAAKKAPAANGQALPCDAWLAFKGASRDSIIQALGMTDVAPCTWDDGLRASRGPDCRLFVTAPVDGCNLVIGSVLPELAYRKKAASWMTGLGASIPQVYAFNCQKNVQVYAFAQVKEQVLCRIYAVAQGSVRVNKGERSDAEEALGFTFPTNDDELFEPVGLTNPDEASIRALAAWWSVDPGRAVGAKGMLGKVEKI